MMNMRMYRKKEQRPREADEHSIYVTVRGDAYRTIFRAKTTLEDQLGDRVSWQVFLTELATRYLHCLPAV
ncbi:hypothetical protein CEW89_17905 [Celeribacter ethanolicus]|uniref:Uncharacterized protein n=1 Tax=Celeribacter ethanolicus TaxID=1758178 RepID=A0A291GGG5_9RHOB|nr:hypothetical protein CEW89_17905 [Celeribacter ethanolicus]